MLRSSRAGHVTQHEVEEIELHFRYFIPSFKCCKHIRRGKTQVSISTSFSLLSAFLFRPYLRIFNAPRPWPRSSISGPINACISYNMYYNMGKPLISYTEIYELGGRNNACQLRSLNYHETTNIPVIFSKKAPDVKTHIRMKS
jgi:hypothetical protein